MNVTCSAEPCPILLNASCVFYTGSNLIYTGIVTNDNLETALQKIDAKFGDAGLGYIFTNGITQSAPGQPVKLGGTLIQNTIITNNGYTFTFTENVIAAKHITAGGTSAQFVKGDGTLDSTSYQPTGNYITALTGDGTASGPGSAAFTLTSVSALYAGTWGSATTVPQFTIDSKGRVLSVTNVPISLPLPSATFVGDVYGSGSLASNITLTIANVLASPGTYGSGTQIPVITVNSKGQITNISQTPVAGGGGSGTVTNVSVTPGTGISASVTNPTTTPNITITNTAPDQIVTLNSGTGIGISGTYPNFTITNTSPSSGGTVTNVTASSPLSSSGGTTPNISIQQSSALQDGYLSSADWVTFNSKVGGSGTVNYVPKWSSTTGLTDSQIFDNGSQIDLLNSTRPVLSVLNTGLSVNSVSALNDADSYNLKFNAIGSSGNAQSADIFLDGNGAANGAAFIIRNNNGSINLTPSNNDINLNATNPQLYATTGGIRFTNNSTSQGFVFGNYTTQSSGSLFQIVNNYLNVGQTFPFTVFANGNVLLGTTTQTDAGYKLDVAGTTRLNGNSTVNGTLGVGTATPNASSLVEMVSTSSGLLIPRMTTAQINAISSPAQGLMAYSTDENVLYYYDNDFGAWWCDNPQWRAKNGIDVFEDFLGGYTRGVIGTPYSPLFMLRVANSGLIRQAAGGSNRPGIINFSTSTTSNAQSGIYTDDINNNGYLLGGGKILVEIDVQVPTLSDGTNTFRWWGGFSNNAAWISGAGISSLCFFYDSQNAFGYGASNNWQLMASNNNIRTVTVTAIPVTAGQWYRLRMVINANATLCDFTIDGTLVKSENTNIPATTIQLALGCNLIKSVGVAERNIWIDYYRIKQKFTTQR